ncbi:MAG: hypothetical protein A2W80_02970 [Candidatus Riflebacteria bacterium GWC2_50_8]|nr:MAG: hypothetical protein A2W80_02970 [Candidatus Riflebacteria bacterium GWC2_50_8]
MEIKQVTIELNEDTIRKLEEKALKAGKNWESLAADLIKTGLGDTPGQPVALSMPGVAMLKETSEPILPVSRETGSGPGLTRDTSMPMTGPATPDFPPERLRRKAELENKMRELALVIETADEADKEKYGMQYAILAAELDALI